MGASRERESLQSLSSLLQEQRGICLLDYKDRWLERRLLGRVRMTQCSDVPMYVEYVRKNPQEMDRLLDALAINISGFFRDPDVYAAIAAVVFDGWRKSYHDRRLFRAWSCACAQGEEPYSLSALWEDWAHGSRRKFDGELRISSSDIDDSAVRRARCADYHAPALKEIPSDFRGWFTLKGERMIVSPAIRKRVQFVVENVMIPGRRRKMDLVLCRNFLIFLDRSAREQMMEVLRDALAPGGYLVLGRAETLPEQAGDSFAAVDLGHRIYRKKMGVNLK
jgi:chemotaxis protein methyltransferase CheR